MHIHRRSTANNETSTILRFYRGCSIGSQKLEENVSTILDNIKLCNAALVIGNSQAANRIHADIIMQAINDSTLD